MEKLKERIEEIPTLIKIDLFEHDICENRFLKEDMDRYAKKLLTVTRAFAEVLQI